LKLDDSRTSNRKSEISNWTRVQFGLGMQDSSNFKILFTVFGLAFLLVSCTQQMADQPRYDPLQASSFFSNGSSARPLPTGVISRDQSSSDQSLETIDKFPFPVDSDVMSRGRERYNIYCSPCHDYVGTGNGMAAIRGFERKPASFQSDDLRAAPVGHFVDVITNGFGAMPAYSNQIPIRDRWAITAYIRALQLSQSATINDVPPDEKQRLESEKAK
jgi:cbb3-type cytochrome c oxidase subunit III